jgi:hypothetical protein
MADPLTPMSTGRSPRAGRDRNETNVYRPY